MTQQTQDPTDTKEPTDKIGVINTDADRRMPLPQKSPQTQDPTHVFSERCAFQSGCTRHFSAHTKYQRKE